jgi:hypothetical protein
MPRVSPLAPLAIAPPAIPPISAFRTFLLEDFRLALTRPRVPPTSAPAGTAEDCRSTWRPDFTTPYWTDTLWPARCAQLPLAQSKATSMPTTQPGKTGDILLLISPPILSNSNVWTMLGFYRKLIHASIVQ